MIKTIFFDIGGVLVHVDSSRVIQRLAARLKVSPADIKQALDRDLMQAYEKGFLSSDQFYEQLLAGCSSAEKIDVEIFKNYWQDVLFPNSEGIALLQRASQNFPVWLLSNTNDFHFELLLRDFAFMTWIKGGTYSFIEGSMKPEPEIYVRAIQRSGYQPGEILFLDDLAENVHAAKRLGIQAIQYTDYNSFSRELLIDHPELGYLL